MGIEGQFAGLSAPTRREPAFVGDTPGRSYLRDIRRFAMLEKDQEYALATRWRNHGDRDAANQLVGSHLRLAVKIAMGHAKSGDVAQAVQILQHAEQIKPSAHAELLMAIGYMKGFQLVF